VRGVQPEQTTAIPRLVIRLKKIIVRILMGDDVLSNIPFDYLRDGVRCAYAGPGAEGHFSKSTITLSGINMVAGMRYNPRWADGHETDLYLWYCAA